MRSEDGSFMIYIQQTIELAPPPTRPLLCPVAQLRVPVVYERLKAPATFVTPPLLAPRLDQSSKHRLIIRFWTLVEARVE